MPSGSGESSTEQTHGLAARGLLMESSAQKRSRMALSLASAAQCIRLSHCV